MERKRRDNWNQIKKQMKGCTHNTILTQIYQGLHSTWYEHDPELGPIREKKEEITIPCFEEQTEIGWKHMLLGRISKRWGRANERLTSNFKKPIDADTWSARLIRILLNKTQDLWIERNKSVHGKNSGLSTSAEECREIRMVIKKFYKYIKPLVLPQDKWLFRQSEKIKLEEKPSNQVAWIDAMERVYNDLLHVIEHQSFFKNRRVMTF